MWARFVALMARREAGTTLALFRAAVGLILLYEVADLWLTGAWDLLLVPLDEGGIDDLRGSHWLVRLLGGPTAATLRWLGVLVATGATLVAVGLGTRVAALVTLFSAQALLYAHPGSGGGHDRMLIIALGYLVLARSDTTLSAACRLRTGNWTCEDLVPAWPRLLMVYQLVLIYTATGLSKLGAEWWPHGDYLAVYRAMLHPWFARGDHAWVAWIAPLLQLGAAVTVPFEVGWLLVLFWLSWRHRTTGLRARIGRLPVREVWVTMGIVLHGTLWAMLDLGPFSAITIAWYLNLYAPEELTRAFRARFAGLGW